MIALISLKKYFPMPFRIGRCALVALGIFALSPGTLSAAVYDSKEMMAAARINGKYCTGALSVTRQNVPLTSDIVLTGTDLSRTNPNIYPLYNKLWAMNASAARSGNVSSLKTYFVAITSNGYFTQFAPYKPKTWFGKKPKWLAKYPPYNELLFQGGVLLQAMSQSFGLLKPYLTDAEAASARKWGKTLYKAMASKPLPKGPDIQGSMSAGFITWGLVAGDSSMVKKGKGLFKKVAKGIKRNGSHSFWMDGHADGKQLRYFQMTYGFLTVSAWAMAKNGKGTSLFTKRYGGGSLLDGINYLLAASYDPNMRKGIQTNQIQVEKWTRNTRSGHLESLAYIELVEDAGIKAAQVPLMKQVLQRKGKGYVSGFFGGYTSCLTR